MRGCQVDIQKLKFFLVLVEEMNFTNAAYELHISQSSLSKNIKSLEDELCVTLFDRTTKRVQLTPAGREFAIYANQIVDAYENMLVSMSKYSIKKKITLSSTQVLSYYGLTNCIMKYSEMHTNLDIIVTELEPNQVIKDLRSKSVDLAIIYQEYLDSKEYDFYPLVKDKLILVVGKRHPLSGQSIVSIGDLANEVFLMIRANDIDTKVTVALCEEFNYAPNLSPLNLRLNSMEKYLMQGNCVSIMPKGIAKSFDESEIVIIDLKEVVPRTLGFAVPKCKRNKDIDHLINYILNNYSHVLIN